MFMVGLQMTMTTTALNKNEDHEGIDEHAGDGHPYLGKVVLGDYDDKHTDNRDVCNNQNSNGQSIL